MAFYSKFSFVDGSELTPLTSAVDFNTAAVGVIIERNDGVRFIKTVKGVWDSFKISAATEETYERFKVTVADASAAGETFTFDGVTYTSTGAETGADVAAGFLSLYNVASGTSWTGEAVDNVITFTAKEPGDVPSITFDDFTGTIIINDIYDYEQGSWGGSSGVPDANNALLLHKNKLEQDYALPQGYNALVAGPWTVTGEYILTVSPDATFVVI